MLQNRVDPFGNIIRTSARGAWMGNRGLIHNDKKEIIRPWKLIPWITCSLQFRGRHRIVMTPGLYTELFFLDEATAFSAGHRPCKECRREDHLRFKKYWITGNPEYGFTEKTRIGEIDRIIHAERIDAKGKKLSYTAEIGELPDGTFIIHDDLPALVTGKFIYPWTAAGYEKGIDRPLTAPMHVLTPKTIVNTFRAGYLPQTSLTSI